PSSDLLSFPTRRSSDLDASFQRHVFVERKSRRAARRCPRFRNAPEEAAMTDTPADPLIELFQSELREQSAILARSLMQLAANPGDRKSTRLNSSHVKIS